MNTSIQAKKQAVPAPTRSVSLIILLLVLGIGALFGGISLIISPSGDLLQMPLSLLENSPFTSYVIPGIILGLMLGVLPLLIVYGLIKRPACRPAEKLNVYRDTHWSWTFSLYIGYALVIWLIVQVYFLQTVTLVHIIYWVLGFAIQIVTLLPATRAKYLLSAEERAAAN